MDEIKRLVVATKHSPWVLLIAAFVVTVITILYYIFGG